MTGAPRPPIDAEAARFLSPGEVMLCYACRAAGFCRLGLRTMAPDGERAVLAHLTCPESHEDQAGAARAGWTAAAFDEVLGHLGPLNGAMTVTGTLAVDLERPAPIGRDVEIRAWVERVEGRRWYLAAEMRLDPAGARLAHARGVFVERRPDHFHSHGEWLATQDETAAEPH
jgi:hypothetical protein